MPAVSPARRLLVPGLILSLFSANAYAAPAGTVIANTASLRFDIGGSELELSSNTVQLVVTERLDVTVSADASAAVGLPQGENAVRFRVANTGNGAEVFNLTTEVGNEGAAVLRIAADDDGNGVYDPKIDRELPSPQLALDAGKDAALFVIVGGVNVPTSVTLKADAATGTGAKGTVFAGKGDGGGDAVVGLTGASAKATTTLTPARGASLAKSQSILAPDGSARAMRGAVITYTLEARFTGPAAGAVVEDPVPAGTTYVPGSITLNDQTLTDAADADEGRLTANTVVVALGDLAGPGLRTIRFQVKIN